MNQHSAVTQQQQLDRLSHHSREACTSLLVMAFQSFSRSSASPDHGHDIKQPSGICDADVTAFVRALMELIAQSVRQNLTGDQFIERLQSLKIGITDELAAAEKFQQAKSLLHPVLSLTSCSNSAVPKFRELEWRIEMEVHRKNLRNVYTPVVLMKFTCNGNTSASNNSSSGSQFVRMRVCDVHHMRDVLDEALIEANSHKIERQVRKWT